ncbi:formyltetrahydrofolate deformylase [Pseudohaliea rubra]|uniref:Formyltetrahydrofolate deformylase n=1 Tax=Pseudohaliea rubra DSM 19751 TaxID=1265313 RepID=A0A095VTJ2_9GAMM|nr:formyltetrahydrofolate deformylase [Pseudohaliea rubra]KGE04675.1 Formyltetrahydrofolate deformylase [Pseudohaliea rubra DSM 19751]
MAVAAPESPPRAYVLSFRCPDRLGVVARYSGLMYDCGAYITEVSNYSDPVTAMFFLRCVFDDRAMTVPYAELARRLEALASTMAMDYTLRPVSERPRVLVAVSRYDHCLSALLTKWKAGALPADIVAVVSNHEDCRRLVEFHGLPYHHLPVSADNKREQEAQLHALVEGQRVDLLVLARYMQILSDDLCRRLEGRAINIHHSFLPGFKGARPYHQAYERGVKVIGATAHYVTSDLDEGPIIAQEVRPIDHQVSVQQMVLYGHDIEATALAQAVRLHCEQRVILNGQRTVIL